MHVKRLHSSSVIPDRSYGGKKEGGKKRLKKREKKRKKTKCPFNFPTLVCRTFSEEKARHPAHAYTTHSNSIDSKRQCITPSGSQFAYQHLGNFVSGKDRTRTGVKPGASGLPWMIIIRGSTGRRRLIRSRLFCNSCTRHPPPLPSTPHGLDGRWAMTDKVERNMMWNVRLRCRDFCQSRPWITDRRKPHATLGH